jgi:hypothetical protein
MTTRLSEKILNQSGEGVQFTLVCPSTGHPVSVIKAKQIDLPNGQATWWKCPNCQGWHVRIERAEPTENG